MQDDDASSVQTQSKSWSLREVFRSEDWLAVLVGGLILCVSLAATGLSTSEDYDSRVEEIERRTAALQKLEAGARDNAKAELRTQVKSEESELEALSSGLFSNPIKPLVAKLGSWNSNPADAFVKSGRSLVPGLLGTFMISLILFSLGIALKGEPPLRFVAAFAGVFGFAVLAYLLAGQSVVKHYNLEFALWAILIGMLISNTVGTPRFLLPALRTEFYIKTGLVLLGAEILLSRLLVLGLPGIFVSWVVTPIVLVSTYMFGQYILRIPSRSLNMVISADMSVCGVSAAIATAAACRAKKEELSLAIGISLSFTVIMMVVMPAVIRALGMNEVLGGAWLGGTIDSTGAVAAAGGMLGETALAVAATVKMIQNILIGVVAFFVALYWVMYVEPSTDGANPNAMEIWYRFPKFVLGFVGASVVCSLIYSSGVSGGALVEATIDGTTEILRGWFFCLAFVSIGLETNFLAFSQYLKGGKALILYVCGQALNLTLTLLMAWIMFEKVFPQAAASLSR